MAEIVVRRPKAWQDKLRAYKIVIDGEGVGTIREGEEKRFAVSPGNHILRLTIDWKGSREFEVSAAEDMPVLFEASPIKQPMPSVGAIIRMLFSREPYIRLEPIS